MTRNEKKLLVLHDRNRRMAERIKKASAGHKGTRDLHARHVVDVVAEIKTQLRIEKKRNAA